MARDESTYGFSKQDAEALVGGGVHSIETEIPEFAGSGGGGGAKSGHCVLPLGSPAASYSISTPISGGTQTNSIIPGVAGGLKLEWALTGVDATQVVATRTTESVLLYNPLPIALPNDAVVQWKENVDGFKMIDTWICGTGVAGSISVGGDISDPVSENSSKSISMGYTIGV